MAIRTKSNLRGLRDIHTRSGRVDRSDVPYMAYMKISSLEMEKARREQEKFSAQARIDNINARMVEIESEKKQLLAHLSKRERRTGTGGQDHGKEPQTERSYKKGPGFRIKY